MRIGVFCTAIALLTASSLMAQEDVLRPNGRPEGSSSRSSKQTSPFVFGVEAGANLNFFGQSYTSTPDIENSPEAALQSGFGVSPELGVFIDLGLAPGFGLQFRLAYDPKTASGSTDGIIDAVPVDGIGPDGPGQTQGFTITPMTVTAEHCLQVHNIAAAILFRADVTPELFLTLGPIFQFAISDVTRTDKVTRVSPDDTWITVDYDLQPGQYESIERTTNVAQNLLPSVSSANTTAAYATTRVGLELGIGYRFELTPTLYLAPNLRYQYLFTAMNGSFQATDLSQPFTQSEAILSYDSSTLNTVALVIQLGFTL